MNNTISLSMLKDLYSSPLSSTILKVDDEDAYIVRTFDKIYENCWVLELCTDDYIQYIRDQNITASPSQKLKYFLDSFIENNQINLQYKVEIYSTHVLTQEMIAPLLKIKFDSVYNIKTYLDSLDMNLEFYRCFVRKYES